MTIKMFTKPTGLIISIPAAAMPLVTTPQKAVMLLAIFFMLDFITGIMASWAEFKKMKPSVTQYGKRYLISSAKLKLSGVKFITYAMGILCAWGIEQVFLIREIPSGHISMKNLTLTTIVIGFFCAIEFYSIFFENIKRMGFDIIQKVKKITSEGWNLYKSVKNEN